MSEDKHAADLSCDKPFALFDDKEILKMMKSCAFDVEEVEQYLPPHVAYFAKKHHLELSRHSEAQSLYSSADSDPETGPPPCASVENMH